MKPGDILVGKVTPKSESPVTPEEKLLRAIFGEKASDVRDTSMRLSPGVAGTVVGVKIFTRRGVDKDERHMAIEKTEIDSLHKDRNDERAIIERFIYGRLQEILLGKMIVKGPKGIKTKEAVTEALLKDQPKGVWWEIIVDDEATVKEAEQLKKQLDDSVKRLNAWFENKVDKLQAGDDLLPGVLKMVKVFVAVKRKLQPGDKMAGRHGNKGVISRIVPVEDLPHLEDGTPVDIVLNPLGVPSRMNVGQILETHLGWASAGVGSQIREAIAEYEHQGKIEILKNQLLKIYDEKDAE